MKIVIFFEANQDEKSVFVKACKAVPPPYGKKQIYDDDANIIGGGIVPTKRQASKWLMKKGAAYKFGGRIGS